MTSRDGAQRRAAYIVPNSRDQLIPADLNVVSGYFLVLGVVTLLATTITDLVYAVADPRIRQG